MSASAVQQRVLTGHLIQMVMRGLPIANCQNVSANYSYGAQPIRGIGDVGPNEIVNGTWDGSITIARFFMRKENLAALGLTPLGVSDILTLEPFVIQVIDKASGRTIRSYEGCKPATGGENFIASTAGGENLNVMCTNVRGPEDQTGTTLGNIGAATQQIVGALKGL